MSELAGERVLVAPSSFGAADQSPMNRLEDTGCEIVNNPFGRRLTKEETQELLGQGITGLIAGLEPLDRDVLSTSSLKVISRCGSGMENVDLEVAQELGIAVRSTPDAPVSSVAELTLAAMLNLLRSVCAMNHDLHNGVWNKRIGCQLEGRTVAIIGYGRIGRRVAELLGPFRTQLLVVDPALEATAGGVEVVPLAEALARADIITLHSSGGACLLGSKEFAAMKPGMLILNPGRGILIDEQALLGALRDQTVAGAWLDTFCDEPYGGSLTGFQEVLLTPHIGSYTRECRLRMEMEAVEHLIEGFAFVRRNSEH